jgi:hypothetical protein
MARVSFVNLVPKWNRALALVGMARPAPSQDRDCHVVSRNPRWSFQGNRIAPTYSTRVQSSCGMAKNPG